MSTEHTKELRAEVKRFTTELGRLHWMLEELVLDVRRKWIMNGWMRPKEL